MGGLRCVDGSFLTVSPRVCADSLGTPYEVTLELCRDGVPYGTVGERCGWLLARLAGAVAAARLDHAGQGRRWPDPEDRFPQEPSDGELFALRYRGRTEAVGDRVGDTVGVTVGGELRCQVRTFPVWLPVTRGPARRAAVGRWRVTRRAVVEAWGRTGVGLRAVLTSSQLAAFLEDLVAEAERCLAGACGEAPPGKAVAREVTGWSETR